MPGELEVAGIGASSQSADRAEGGRVCRPGGAWAGEGDLVPGIKAVDFEDESHFARQAEASTERSVEILRTGVVEVPCAGARSVSDQILLRAGSRDILRSLERVGVNILNLAEIGGEIALG